MRIVSWFLEELKNILFAGLMCAMLLTILYFVSKPIWGFFFALLIAYLIADLVKQAVIAGSKMYTRNFSPRPKDEIHAGYAFLGFFGYVAIGALASAYLGGWFTAWAAQGPVIPLVVTNLGAIILLYADYYITRKT